MEAAIFSPSSAANASAPSSPASVIPRACHRWCASDSAARPAARTTSPRSCASRRSRRTLRRSAGLNQKRVAKVQTGTQVYFAAYNSNNWTGFLTSQYLAVATAPDGTTSVIINPLVNWDASAFSPASRERHLRQTGAAGGSSGEPALDPDVARTMITSNESTQAGIPFTWSSARRRRRSRAPSSRTSMRSIRARPPAAHGP